MENTRSEPGFAGGLRKGVDGWLFFLVLLLTMGTPTSSILVAPYMYRTAMGNSTSYPELKNALFVSLSILVLRATLSVYGGIILWLERPGAPRRVQYIFLAMGLLTVVWQLWPFPKNVPGYLLADLTLDPLRTLASLIGLTLWGLYLAQSRRVEATYQ